LENDILNDELPLGSKIDALYNLRAERLEKSKEVDRLKTIETELTNQILNSLQQSGMKKATGALATFSYTSTTVPKLIDYNSLKEYILTSGNIQLLERRISTPAFKELFELFGSIPGLEPYTFDKPSLTRSTK
jgi:hypothetical protein